MDVYVSSLHLSLINERAVYIHGLKHVANLQHYEIFCTVDWFSNDNVINTVTQPLMVKN